MKYLIRSGMKVSEADTKEEAVRVLASMMTIDKEDIARQLDENDKAVTCYGFVDGVIWRNPREERANLLGEGD